MSLWLIQLYSEEQAPSSAPYSIEVLAGHVQARAPGWTVKMDVLDNRSPEDLDAMLLQLARAPVDVLGISVAQGTYTLALQLLDRIYAATGAAHGQPQLVLGNSLPTYRPQSYLDRYPGVLIVRGFGEEALLRILARVQARSDPLRPAVPAAPAEVFADIPSLTMLREGRLHSTPIEWPRQYAVPAWVDTTRYFARVEASRGCHYDVCTFCTRPVRERGEPRWIRYPIEQIVDTIVKLKERGVERFTFCDEDFIGSDPDGCLELAERLEAVGGAPPFSFSTRADNIFRAGADEVEAARRVALFRRLKQVGLSLVFVGTESFCDAQLKRYGKNASAQGNVRALHLLESLGLPVEAGMITFDPFMSVADLQENIDNLGRHALWKVMSQTLSKIDVQEATPLKRWLDRRHLLGAYDENQMTYAYSFVDPVIARIVDLCQSWKQETDYAYRLARNAQRMALFDAFPNDAMLAAKYLNFKFLEDMTAAVQRGEVHIAKVIKDAQAQRAKVMRMLLATADSPRVHLALGDRLSKEISGFLGVLC